MKIFIFTALTFFALNAHAYTCTDVTHLYSVTATASSDPFEKPATASVNNGPTTSVLNCISQTATFDRITTICEGNLQITTRQFAPVRLTVDYSQLTGDRLAALAFTDGTELFPMSCK